jgi:hypothetical protein
MTMAKKMKRGGSGKGKSMKRGRGRAPTEKQKQNYYRLIEKGAERTLSTLAKHNPKAAERIVAKVM